MKRFGWLMLLACGMAAAQSTYSGDATRSAVVFSQWSLQGQAANTYTFSPTSLCMFGSAGIGTFPAFSSFGISGPVAPVYINDSGTPANSEIVTPSAVLTCGVTVSPAHTHATFALQSGTAGLQEALNSVATAALERPMAILLDRNWYATAKTLPGVTAAGLIAAAKGSPAAYLEDITTVPHSLYVWNGTAYTVGTWTNAVPAVTVGAAAGTAPAISVSGVASIGTVQLTTGTATTTGTLYTLDWPTTGSFQYAPTCTVTSTGSNVLTSFSGATTYGSSHATLTVSVTGAPVAATVFLVSYSCL